VVVVAVAKDFAADCKSPTHSISMLLFLNENKLCLSGEPKCVYRVEMCDL